MRALADHKGFVRYDTVAVFAFLVESWLELAQRVHSSNVMAILAMGASPCLESVLSLS